MKALKWLLYGFLGLAALALAAAAAALTIVDGAFVKARLERAMKEKNRVLKIEGTPALRLFPVAGIALGKTSLSEPGGGKTFVSVESAEVAVRVMPLLSGEIAIETLKLSGLRLNVVRHKDGATNFSDLAGPGGKEGGGGRRAALRLAQASIDDVNVRYRDEATGQEVDVAELNLKTGRLDGDTPGEVALQARVTGRRPEADLRAQASGALSFNLARDEFAFDKFAAQVKGRLDQESIAAEFSAPKLQVGGGRASGAEIRGSLQLRGTRALDLSYTAAFSGPPLALDFKAKLDESSIKAKATLADLEPLQADFALEADRLNLDRYFPPERRDADPNRKIDLSGLKGKTVAGKLAIGTLVYRNARLENVKAEIKLAGGKLEVAPLTADLYGGTLAGAVSADADGPKFHVKNTAQNVAVGALLRDVTRKDFLEGRGSLALDVQSVGGTPAALKKALGGSARVEMREGAIKGVNLTEKLRKPGGAQKTEFSNLSASFNIRNGVARNDDLKAHSPAMNLAGAGNLDIGNNRIDYTARASLGGGVSVPLKLSGALDAPDWSVDYTALAGGVVGGAVGGAADTVKKGASSAGGMLRGLFGR